MKLLFGLLISLFLAVGIAASAAYVACDGNFNDTCMDKSIHIEIDE